MPRELWGRRFRLPGFAINVLFLFVLTDGLLFHSGWYNKYLEPASTAGEVEYHLYWLKRAPRPMVPDVLVVGDSRIAEGFSARTANAAAEGRVHFTNLGMPGATPRVWYYAVRDADPARKRFAAILIAMDDYSDRDRPDAPERFESDIGYVAGRLRYTDCWSFARSYPLFGGQRTAFTECILRGIALRPDLLSFLADIPRRLERARDWRNNGVAYLDAYGGKPEELTGLTVDLAAHSIHFPTGLKDWQISTVKTFVLPKSVPQKGALTEYRRKWLGGIVNLYGNSRTRIVFVQIPRAPWPLPQSTAPERMLDSVKDRVTLLPRDTFADLERPELFADGLHLNHAGRQVFSERLGREMRRLLENH